MSAGVPLQCIATKPAPCSAATAARLDETSFSSVAPAARAAGATGALAVSIDTRTSPSRARAAEAQSAEGVLSAEGRLPNLTCERLDHGHSAAKLLVGRDP